MKNKGSLILKIAIPVVAVFVIAVIINQQFSVNDLKKELEATNNLIEQETIKNEELKYSLEQNQISGDAFAEEYARSKLDYAKQDERVFINISGD